MFGQQLSALVYLVVIEKKEDSHQGYQHDAIAFMFVKFATRNIYTLLLNYQISSVNLKGIRQKIKLMNHTNKEFNKNFSIITSYEDVKLHYTI